MLQQSLLTQNMFLVLEMVQFSIQQSLLPVLQVDPDEYATHSD